MEVHSLHFWLRHTKAYTGVYSMTHLVNKDADIRARPHTRKNSAESSPSHTSSLPRSPSVSRAISSRAHFLRFLPSWSRLFPRGALHVHRFIPISHSSVVQPIRAVLQGARTARRHRRSDAGVQTDLSFTCACVQLFGSAHFYSAHIGTFPRQLYLHAQDAIVSRPELQRIIDACEAAGTEAAPYCTTSALLQFSEGWVPPSVSPALARFKLLWECFVALHVREWNTHNVLSAFLISCLTVCSCARYLVTDLARQSILTVFQIQDAESSPRPARPHCALWLAR